MTPQQQALISVERQVEHVVREVVSKMAHAEGSLVEVRVAVPAGWPSQDVRALVERSLAEHGFDFVDVCACPPEGDLLALSSLRIERRWAE